MIKNYSNRKNNFIVKIRKSAIMNDRIHFIYQRGILDDKEDKNGNYRFGLPRIFPFGYDIGL